jgi:hypothetical protein
MSTVIVPQTWQVSVPIPVHLETTENAQEGIFLRVSESYGYGDMDPSEHILFEVAAKLPVDPSGCAPKDFEMDCRVHTDFSIHLGLRMKHFRDLQGKRQPEFLRVHFSAFGKLDVVLGNTVPITSGIRRHWCVRKPAPAKRHHCRVRKPIPAKQPPASPPQTQPQAASTKVRNSQPPAPQNSRNRRSSTSALRPEEGSSPGRHRPSYQDILWYYVWRIYLSFTM